MAPMLKAMLIGEHWQHSLQSFVGKLDHPPAAFTNEVFMIGLRDCRLVAFEPLAEFVGADQPAFQQQVEGAIDGGHADSLPPTLQLAPNAFDREVVLGQEDDLSDEIALAGERLMMLSEMSAEALEKSRPFSLVQACHRRGHLRG